MTSYKVEKTFYWETREYKEGQTIMPISPEEKETVKKWETEGWVTKRIYIQELKEKIDKEFPGLWKETEACLSAISARRLKDYNDPITLFIVGAASSGKTTILSLFYEATEDVFKSDNFTPKSFVSHAANVKAEKLEEIDLLPKIKDKTLITPELAPVFGKNKDEILENFAILARVLDGEGFESDSGSKGHRGYTGDFRFTWLGATTPLSKTAWDTMSKIGHRILFCRMDSQKKQENDYVHNFLKEKGYKQKINEIREKMKPVLEEMERDGYYSLPWSKEADEPIFYKIVRTALLVRRLRAKVSVWSEKTQEGETIFNYSTSLPESPERLISALYNLARGRALLYKKTQLEESDIEVVYRIGLSSMPYERCDLFLMLLKHNGFLTTDQVEKELNCTKPTARKTMQMLEILKVVEASYEDLITKRMAAITLKSEFKWVLKDNLLLRVFHEVRESAVNAKKEEDN